MPLAQLDPAVISDEAVDEYSTLSFGSLDLEIDDSKAACFGRFLVSFKQSFYDTFFFEGRIIPCF